MPEPIETEILRQLAAVRRELKLVRALLVFTSVLLAVVFLPPFVMMLFADGGSHVPSYVAPVLGIAVAIIVAAVIVSHFVPSRPALSESSGKNPDA